jgi:CDGSH-type Zn-finger protein
MDKPVIADRKPMKVDLEVGDHYWCTCGRSSNQPWCDGSHKGTSFTPMAMKVEEATEAHMCMCKHSKNPGFCDGAHAKLPKDDG